MLASEVIAKLQEAIIEYGDHPITAMDGSDPADPMEVRSVELSTDEFFGDSNSISDYRRNVPHFHLS